MDKKCLFSAPHSFLGDLKGKFDAIMPTEFREIWVADDLVADAHLDAWIVNPGQGFIANSDALNLFPALSAIITPSTGSNHIDRDECRRRGIECYSLLDDRETLDAISASAEYTFLLLLNSLRRLDLAKNEVSARRWRDNEESMRGMELSGRQVGIVGMGRIGKKLARWCRAFDAKAAYYDPYVEGADISHWPLERIFSESDVVCVCCALTAETAGMIGKDLLTRLKPNARLINSSRGEVMNQSDLFDVLSMRKDLSVALDVLSGEVTKTHLDSPLLGMHDSGQIVISPHIAGATVESQTKAAFGALNLLKRHYSKQMA